MQTELAQQGIQARLSLQVMGTKQVAGRVERRPWTEAETSVLVARYPTSEPAATIAASLSRSKGAIWGKARRLGLRRRAPKVSEQQEFCFSPVGGGMQIIPLLKPRKPTPTGQRTAIGGREGIWSQELRERMERLWFADFHHRCIAEVLGVSPGSVASKASNMGLPRRADPKALITDVAAARKIDQQQDPLPKVALDFVGLRIVRRKCNITGKYFWGPAGNIASREVKQTLHWRRRAGGSDFEDHSRPDAANW